MSHTMMLMRRWVLLSRQCKSDLCHVRSFHSLTNGVETLSRSAEDSEMLLCVMVKSALALCLAVGSSDGTQVFYVYYNSCCLQSHKCLKSIFSWLCPKCKKSLFVCHNCWSWWNESVCPELVVSECLIRHTQFELFMFYSQTYFTL